MNESRVKLYITNILEIAKTIVFAIFYFFFHSEIATICHDKGEHKKEKFRLERNIMKIKYKKKVLYEMERYPENCKECPCFSTTPYRCMNECGEEGHCELGYMNGKDMRDFYGKIRFKECGIEDDIRVSIME